MRIVQLLLVALVTFTTASPQAVSISPRQSSQIGDLYAAVIDKLFPWPTIRNAPITSIRFTWGAPEFQVSVQALTAAAAQIDIRYIPAVLTSESPSDSVSEQMDTLMSNPARDAQQIARSVEVRQVSRTMPSDNPLVVAMLKDRPASFPVRDDQDFVSDGWRYECVIQTLTYRVGITLVGNGPGDNIRDPLVKWMTTVRGLALEELQRSQSR